MERATAGGLREPPPVPIVAVRSGLQSYEGPPISWPPGWAGLWTRAHAMPARRINLTGEPELR
jgi:hypothetical protein